MKTYAEVLKNKVHAISYIDATITVPTDAIVKFIDITNLDPQPVEGDLHEDGDFVFLDANPLVVNKTNIVADGVDTITISNLPGRSAISISDIGIYDVEDGEFIFSVDSPGTYTLTVTTPPYNPKEFTINASES